MSASSRPSGSAAARGRRWGILSLALLLVAGAGCATYSDNTREARLDLRRGNFDGGEEKLNRLLGVESSRDLPRSWGSETALALLERATVLQAKGDYRISARDFTAAEKELELLDIANDTVGSIGQYIYSDAATKYKAPPTEKLLLNAFNMINYLAVGDLSGALVEARRFQVMRRYLRDYFPDDTRGAFGSYLAGYAFEKAGEWDVALRHYDDVLAETDVASLHEPIRRLAKAGAAYRTPRLERILEGKAEGTSPGGEVLVILKTGSVPVKEPKRIPIGAAIGLASMYVSGNPKVLEYSVFKVLSYPELTPHRNLYSGGRLRVNGTPYALDPVTNISKEIAAEYEELKPKIIGAALTRMIVRAAATEGARAVGNQGGLGFLAALVVEGTMTVLDKPDTRSWSTLPGQVHIARIPVGRPGTHEIEVDVSGGAGGPLRLRRTVNVEPGGFAVVDFTTLR